MGRNKDKKNRFIIVASVIVLGVILLLLLILDINNTVNKTLSAYNDSQNILSNTLLKTAVVQAENDSSELKDIIQFNVDENFPTSSSSYCIFAKNDNIIFLKDENKN